jgi:integrase
LRVSDVLKLKVKDVKGKSHLMIYEQKTGKYKRFKINQELQQHILSYTANMDVEEYLFKSLRSPFPIKRVQDTKPCSKENRHLRNRYPHSSENIWVPFLSMYERLSVAARDI